jgi:hypothetical protein
VGSCWLLAGGLHRGTRRSSLLGSARGRLSRRRSRVGLACGCGSTSSRRLAHRNRCWCRRLLLILSAHTCCRVLTLLLSGRSGSLQARSPGGLRWHCGRDEGRRLGLCVHRSLLHLDLLGCLDRLGGEALRAALLPGASHLPAILGRGSSSKSIHRVVLGRHA